MKAMVIRRFGDPGVFEPAELPPPAAGPGEVLIRVAGSGVNPVDTKVRSGALPAIAPPFPAVLHGDVSGTVEAVGAGVTRFKPGDAVYAFAGGFKGTGGALAEFMAADAHLVAPAPAAIGLAAAGALPVVALTAWEAVVERGAVRPGQRVLVQGGAGGVGHVALQLAKCAGADVDTTVSSPAKAEIARGLGADRVVLRREETPADYVARLTGGEGYDVVIDTAGGDSLAASFQAVRAGGTVVTIAARSTQDLSPLHARGATLHVVFLVLPILKGAGRARYGQNLGRLARLVDAGKLRPLFDPEVFAFRDVAAAHRKLEEGRAVGKIRLEAAL